MLRKSSLHWGNTNYAKVKKIVAAQLTADISLCTSWAPQPFQEQQKQDAGLWHRLALLSCASLSYAAMMQMPSESHMQHNTNSAFSTWSLDSRYQQAVLSCLHYQFVTLAVPIFLSNMYSTCSTSQKLSIRYFWYNSNYFMFESLLSSKTLPCSSEANEAL